jgi:adenine deaminase
VGEKIMSSLKKKIDAAQGRTPCDLILKNVTYLDVFSCTWKRGDISIVDGTIVGVDPGLKAHREVNAQGQWVVPGFIDAHVHLESSMMTPRYFQEAVLPHGTTTAVCDPHELANVMGVSGIQYFLDSAENMDLSLWVMLSSCVPATHMETNGAGTIGPEKLISLKNHPKALGLAEMMNVPGVLNGDSEVLKKIQGFEDRPLDGHCPLLRGHQLSAYATAGISSCHESSELEEAREKLSKGISVWIREGSVAKDLKALAPLLTLATSTSLGFCTDDRNPLDIAHEGHLDHLIRSAIRYGVSPEVA